VCNKKSVLIDGNIKLMHNYVDYDEMTNNEIILSLQAGRAN